jgi:excinuclease ABC subunit A
MDLTELKDWCMEVEQHMEPQQQQIATEILKEIRTRIDFMLEVGLDYLALDRQSATLSGGESQRIRLATQIGSQLVNVLYILDEPTTGLHTADIDKLLKILHRLVEGGDTVVVIEHNLDVIKTADHIIDLGPEGGQAGGTIVAAGTPEQVAANPDSYTGSYLKALL